MFILIVEAKSGPCTTGIAQIAVQPGTEFDYIVSMEDMTQGARFANYSVEFQRVGSPSWEVLVPPVHAGSPDELQARDRPDGHDPRDSHIGHKRIDLPVVPASGADAIRIKAVRLNCIAAFEEPVHVRSFSLHKKTVPWSE